MRSLLLFLALVCATVLLMTGFASSGKHVKDTIDNVHEYALFGDEYSRW